MFGCVGDIFGQCFFDKSVYTHTGRAGGLNDLFSVAFWNCYFDSVIGFVQQYFEDHKVSGYTGVLVPVTEAETSYGTDLKTFTLDAYIKFITGEESMDTWDDFVSQFNSLGGQQIVDEINAVLGK